MKNELKVGYFEHWSRPPYVFADFMGEQGLSVEKIDFKKKDYLEKYDVAIVEQNGFNDYVENDELYIRDWVSRGGILLFMHQDYMRWAPYFLPPELGHTHLIYRYIPTIMPCTHERSFSGNDRTPYMTYLMPWIEEPGRRLFSEPNVITPDEMLDWHLDVNTFRIIEAPACDSPFPYYGGAKAEHVRTAAQSCFLAGDGWEVLGSYMDPAVKDGALILRAKYGKGMYFLNQVLFPEILDEKADRAMAFWKKYIQNLMAYFARFKNGESEALPPKEKKTLPIKRNYKLAAHMHCLDWHACDAHPGTIHALLRYRQQDICSISIKDNAPFNGRFDAGKYSDDAVLFLDGQEYHPFNFGDSYDHLSNNTYHSLAIGVDPEAYTQEFTRSCYSDEEISKNIQKAIDHVHKHHGVICATHPAVNYWHNYNYDAVDKEPLATLAGSDIEDYWLSGRKIAMMVSVDLFGTRRFYDNPATNFVYLGGKVPCRDSVCDAIRAGHTIAAAGFSEADIFIGDYLPGDTLSVEEAKNSTLSISAEVLSGGIHKVRVYSGADVVFEREEDFGDEIKMEIPLAGFDLKQFIRVEVEGQTEYWICTSTPFYLS